MDYVFCEKLQDGGRVWHIRRCKGTLKPGDQALKALCGQDVAWDLGMEFTKKSLKLTCKRCVKNYRRSVGA